MARQWLHAKRLVAGLKKGCTTGKLVREISIAAKPKAEVVADILDAINERRP